MIAPPLPFMWSASLTRLTIDRYSSSVPSSCSRSNSAADVISWSMLASSLCSSPPSLLVVRLQPAAADDVLHEGLHRAPGGLARVQVSPRVRVGDRHPSISCTNARTLLAARAVRSPVAPSRIASNSDTPWPIGLGRQAA